MLKNSIKVWLIIAAFATGLAYFGNWLWGRQGTLLGIVVSLALIFVVFSLGNQLANSFYRSRKLEGNDPWGLGAKLNTMSRKAKVFPPKIYLIPMSYPTAFVAGMKKDSFTLFISQGLLKRLTPEETEAVIAHLLARLRNKDVLPAMMGAVLAACILSFTEQTPSRSSNIFSKIVFYLFAPFAWLVVAIHSKSSHILQADLLASQWIDNPMNLAKALWKLDSYAHTLSPEVPYSLSHLFIVNPLTGLTWGRYFSVHPPISQRIRKLVGVFPI